MIDWEIVLTALVTSSIVALTVEYVAKPRLEVRTHRTVEMVRVRQELVGTLISVTFSAIVAGEMLPGDLDDENRATFSAEQDRHYLRMQQACRDLFDDAGRYLAVFPGSSAESLIMDGISTLYGVVMSPRPRARQVELVHGLAAALGEVAEVRRIRDARRTYRAMVRARKAIAEARQPREEAGPTG